MSSDFLLISWRDRLYSVEKKVKEKHTHELTYMVQHSQHVLLAIDHAWLTFGVVFVQLIGCLLPFLDPVLERCDQAFHESAAVAQRDDTKRNLNA